MTQRRPTVVLVMAILNFIYGALGILGTLCAGAVYLLIMNPPKMPPGQPNPLEPIASAMKFAAKEIPGYTAYLTAGLLVGLLLATALVIAGVGLLRLRPWARSLCILYAVVQLVQGAGSLYYTLLYVHPVMAKWYEEQARKLPPGTPNFGNNALLNNLGTFVGVGIGVVYAIALLVVMFLPHVRAAFAGQGTETVPQETDYYDPPPGGNVAEDRSL